MSFSFYKNLLPCQVPQPTYFWKSCQVKIKCTVCGAHISALFCLAVWKEWGKCSGDGSGFFGQKWAPILPAAKIGHARLPLKQVVLGMLHEVNFLSIFSFLKKIDQIAILK